MSILELHYQIICCWMCRWIFKWKSYY